MKFVVNSQVLLKGLKGASSVVSANKAMPIIDNNVLFDIRADNKLFIVGTDLETTVVAEVEINNQDGEAKVVVPVVDFLNFIAKCSDRPFIISLNTENFELNISAGEDGDYELPGQDPNPFPEIPEVVTQDAKTITTTEILSRGISKTIFATGTDVLRMSMCGVYFDINEKDLTMVATDAHRLVKFVRNDLSGNLKANFIVPKKALQVAQKVMGTLKGNSEICLYADKQNVLFDFDSIKMVCRLIDLKYPNYEAIIPKNSPNKIKLNRLSFLKMMERLLPFAAQSQPVAKFSLAENASEMKFSTEDSLSAKGGRGSIVGEYEGGAIDIAFSIRFLIDMLSNMDSERVLLEMESYSRAAILRPLEEKEETTEEEATESESARENLLMLVMPYQV